MARSFLSLRQTLMLGAGLGMLVPALVLGFFQVTQKYEREVELQIRAPLRQYADIVSRGVAVHLWNDDQYAASELVEGIMRNPDVFSVTVIDTHKEVIVRRRSASIAGRDLLHEERRVVYNAEHVGDLRIEMSTDRIAAALAGDLLKLAAAFAAQVTISFLLIWRLFDSRVMRPLMRLQGSARRMARGEFDQPLVWHRNDEMGRLVQDLDTMRRELAALIAERVQHAAGVQRLNASLEQRVIERTRELTETLERLTSTQQELVRSEKLAALGALVAGISHELNTPLGNSLTIASTMQAQTKAFAAQMDAPLTRQGLRTFVDNAVEGTDILMRSLIRAVELVSSFKQVAVDQTSGNRRQFGLAETVADIVLTLGPTIRKSSHSVKSEVPPNLVLEGYPGILGQVLVNLINNALLHAFAQRQNGTILISASALDDERVQLTVQDDGVGIDPASLSRVFDPFFTTKLGQGGSGLGLSIAYNLVSNTLGGSIQVTSPPGRGACFTIVMPRVAPQPPAATAAQLA